MEWAMDEDTCDLALALVLGPESLSYILSGLEVPAPKSSGGAEL